MLPTRYPHIFSDVSDLPDLQHKKANSQNCQNFSLCLIRVIRPADCVVKQGKRKYTSH